MKAYLLFPDHDLDLTAALPPQSAALINDLRLNVVFEAMAQGDAVIAKVVPHVLLAGTDDVAVILYRQSVMRELMEKEDFCRNLYAFLKETLAAEHKSYLHMRNRSVSGVIFDAVLSLEVLSGPLQKLKVIANKQKTQATSTAVRRLFEILDEELDDSLFADLLEYSRVFRVPEMLLSARLGDGNKGVDYRLRGFPGTRFRWLKKLIGQWLPPNSYRLDPRDDNGARALNDLRERALGGAASSMQQGKDHVLSFLTNLRDELAFYVGALNVRRRLCARQLPLCFPDIEASGCRSFDAQDLYDIALALASDQPVTGNNVPMTGSRKGTIITGANQGGKSTCLRSIGLSLLMARCGLFVGAGHLTTAMVGGVFTHFKREEDRTLQSGKFDEELRRLDDLLTYVRDDSVVLFNESFSSTNEMEGSAISFDVMDALMASGVRVFFVTHQYTFAHRGFLLRRDQILFLRAPGRKGADRDFRLEPGEPSATSEAADLYQRVFGVALSPSIKTTPSGL
ncbi:DNA mismatch repair protein MutS [Acetobacter malorum]|uniref:DNA mismatch repair protein MutS n=1 Tax=Acetobacter malorum TaxID=178901 RepID=A0A149V223_9PROT|nr:DNA mismatch repair protein MutS [Acetobacter malorum]KXV74185.1 DNA mismatch repair protein MutS [Acetobacter malorum]